MEREKIYLEIEKLYKQIFDKYLESKVNIYQLVDKKLEESNLDYGKLNENQKTKWQIESKLNSDYIFVRNDFYVERLKTEYLNKFINQLNNKEYNDPELLEIVKNTYQELMKPKIDNKYKNLKVCYSPIASPAFLFDNDSLVLYLNYGLNNIKLNGKEFIENKKEKEKYLTKIINDLKLEIENKLNCKVEIKFYKGKI